jgi:transcription antitermination factor NusG
VSESGEAICKRMEKVKSKVWLVVYTKPRWEKKVHEKLGAKGFDAWCPLQKEVHQWTDRKKIVFVPIFKGYVFIHVEQKKCSEVLATLGVLNFVYYERVPAVIRDQDIALLKKFLNEGASFEIVGDASLRTDDKVVVRQGVFMDHIGKVKSAKHNSVMIEIESLQTKILVRFEPGSLQKI